MKPMFKPFSWTVSPQDSRLSTYYDIVSGVKTVLEITHSDRLRRDTDSEILLADNYIGDLDRLAIGALSLLQDSLETEIERRNEKGNRK